MKKPLIQLIDEATLEICQDPTLFKIYSALVYNLDYMLACNNVERAEKNIQKLSLNWTGKTEEKYNSLKLLRMKSFGTI